jgi:K+-transporting ATPase A subunit
MTSNGWLQIALFSVIVIVITRPFGGYITRVFAGERTPLRPLLRPVERSRRIFIRGLCGADVVSMENLPAPAQLRRLILKKARFKRPLRH